MTGFAYPEILVEIVRLFRSGKKEEAADAFYRSVALMRFEFQEGIGMAIRKEMLHRRGAIAHPAVRPPAPALDASTLAALDGWSRGSRNPGSDRGPRPEGEGRYGGRRLQGPRLRGGARARRRGSARFRSRRATPARSRRPAERSARETGAATLAVAADVRSAAAPRAWRDRDAPASSAHRPALRQLRRAARRKFRRSRRRGLAERVRAAPPLGDPDGAPRDPIDQGGGRRRDPVLDIVVGEGADRRT